jgi:hypothetical protein
MRDENPRRCKRSQAQRRRLPLSRRCLGDVEREASAIAVSRPDVHVALLPQLSSATLTRCAAAASRRTNGVTALHQIQVVYGKPI